METNVPLMYDFVSETRLTLAIFNRSMAPYTCSRTRRGLYQTGINYWYAYIR